LDCALDSIETSERGLYGRGPFALGHTSPIEGLFRDAAYFVKELPDLDFQLPATFLYPIHNVRLDARTIHVHQVI
jgi:hypothetical protein